MNLKFRLIKRLENVSVCLDEERDRVLWVRSKTPNLIKNRKLGRWGVNWWSNFVGFFALVSSNTWISCKKGGVTVLISLSPYSFCFFFLLDRSSDMSATARDSQAKANLLSPSFRVLLWLFCFNSLITSLVA